MGERRFQVNRAQTFSLGTFFARQVLVENLLPQWLYFRVGGSDIPSAATADLPVAPMTTQLIPLPATNVVSVGLGAVQTTLGQQIAAGQNAIVTFYDSPLPVGIGSIDLNPTRLGNMAQQKFVVAGSYTMLFPVTTVHIANYSPAWVYVKFGSLVVPTAATADAMVPPMTEKSLTCLPTTQFAFGLSANLVTVGQQVPAGVNIIVTFYEYPTPVTIGTADLNPSKLGQMAQQKFVVASSFTMGFKVTTVHVANYSPAWVYVKFNSLVIPTVATADVAIPPMSEKSLTCLPANDFAFGLSANLVTKGQQVPSGTNIIVTFFEYPTPVSVGTANLNPTRLGQSSQVSFTANTLQALSFPATQVHVSNFLRSWVYLAHDLAAIAALNPEMCLNPGFEIAGGGGPDIWANWVEVPGTGALADVGVPFVHSGAHACRATSGPGAGVAYVYQDFIAAVTPGDIMSLTFWTRGDGTNGAQYAISNLTGGGFIVAPTPTGISGAVYQQVVQYFQIPALCVSIRINLYSLGVANAVGYFDDVSLKVVNPTSANAPVAIPPLAEKSINIPPSTTLALGVANQTIQVATGVPVTRALATFYEYYTALSVGAAPLSPGGYQYAEQIYALGLHTLASLNGLNRDLSNFNRARLTLFFNAQNPTDMAMRVLIYRMYGGAPTLPIASTPYTTSRSIMIEFSAGCLIQLLFSAVDVTGAVIAPAVGQLVLLSDTLEAW